MGAHFIHISIIPLPPLLLDQAIKPDRSAHTLDSNREYPDKPQATTGLDAERR